MIAEEVQHLNMTLDKEQIKEQERDEEKIKTLQEQVSQAMAKSEVPKESNYFTNSEEYTCYADQRS
jgi:hypothetical protein